MARLKIILYCMLVLFGVFRPDSWGAASFTMQAEPLEGLAPLKDVTFVCTGQIDSDANTGKYIAKYTMVFGDGKKEEIVPEEETLSFTHTFVHTYNAGGKFKPYLTIEDSSGVKSSSQKTTIISVTSQTFTVTVSPESRQGFEPLLVTLTLTYTRSDQEDAVYTIDYGDDVIDKITSADTPFIVEHTFQAGVYKIVCSVDDFEADGKKAKFSKVIDPPLLLVVGKWKSAAANEEFSSSPAVDPSTKTVYAGSDDDSLHAFNAANGERKWAFLTGGRVISSPAVAPDGTVYVGSEDYNLYALNPDGMEKWRFPTGGEIYSSPAIGPDGTIYVGSIDGCLYAIDPGGVEKWRFKTSSRITAPPSIGYHLGDSEYRIHIGSLDGNLYTLDLRGALKWVFETGADEVRSSPAIGSDGTIFFTTCKVGAGEYKGVNRIFCINPDGRKKWDSPFKLQRGAFSSPVVSTDGTVYVGSYDNSLYAWNTAGTLKWEFATGRNVKSSPVLGPDETVLVGSADGLLYALDFSGKLKWKFKLDDEVNSSPTIGPDGTIYVGSRDKHVYAFYYKHEKWVDNPTPGSSTTASGKPIIPAWPMMRQNHAQHGKTPITDLAPGILSTYPDYGEGGIPVDVLISVNFNKKMNSSLTATLKESIADSPGKSVDTEMTLSNDGKTAFISLPKQGRLNHGATYMISVNGNDTDGKEMLIPWTWAFTTQPEFEVPEVKSSDSNSGCFIDAAGNNTGPMLHAGSRPCVIFLLVIIIAGSAIHGSRRAVLSLFLAFYSILHVDRK